jgi:hypothetical protein
MAQKKWTVLDTCRFADAVIANEGRDLTADQLKALIALCDEVDRSPDSAEPMVWRIQTVLGYPVKAADTSKLDRAVAQLFLEHDPRLKRQAKL